MADQSRQQQLTRKLHDQDQDQWQLLGPSFSAAGQTGKFLTAGAAGITLLMLSGLTFTGTVMTLIMATPVLVLFSPVLVPAAIVQFLTAAGLVFSGGCGMAAIPAFSWMYKNVSSYVAAKKRGNAYGQFVQICL
ncbi:oleosin Ara h 15.0101 [Pyrus x bretschneideri]|uniref:oleosin Ara h 15.0101 n=1 Tax=Pyrus x bretschneideri TaxID=225117 RepID=UPI00202E8461|nr:oleosin Ara h 15.0101 [Pyrus x bretschneideri]